MRRPAAALLGTLAGTVLLVGAKYGSTPPAANAGDSIVSSDSGPAAAGQSGDPAAAAASPGQGTGATPVPSGRTTTTGATPPRGTPTAARPTGGTGATTAAPACTTASGSAINVTSPGVGAVTVTVQVCAGVLKTATSALSRSNWDRNSKAMPALNSLAIANYRTNFAAIHYSGATLTSNAYQASLRSALTRAGA